MNKILSNRKFPLYGWIGLALIIVFWTLNWSLSGLRTHWGFFPLWLGYCLTIDALVYMRKGTSLLNRNRIAYILLFIISAPSWWLFEVINWRLQNWYYNGKEFFTDFQYVLFATVSFSTVMPAVFGTAELASTFKWIKRIQSAPKITPKPATLIAFFISGFLMLFLLLGYPRYFYPFTWISIYFLLEPINVLLKNRSLLQNTANRDWRPVLSLWIGCLICAFFWEMWNFYSYPKWIYRIPFVNFLHIFEMPALGYLGYLPFSLELFALYHLIVGIFKPGKAWNYIQLEL